MEKILLLAHTESDGTLARPALGDADGGARPGRPIDHRAGGRRGRARRQPGGRLRRGAIPGAFRARLSPSPATPPMRPPPRRSAGLPAPQ